MIGLASQQRTRLQETIQRSDRTHLDRRHTAQDMFRSELRRMFQTSCAQQLPQRFERVAMELMHTGGFVGHVEFAPARRVLRGDARRAAAGVTALRLDTAQREHEAARGVAPVRAHRERARDIERTGDAPRRADAHTVAQVQSDQRVVHQHQRFVHRHPDVIDEFRRSRAGAALAAVDHDEIRQQPGLVHRFGDGEPLPGMPDGELEPGRLAAGQCAHLGDEFKQLNRR